MTYNIIISNIIITYNNDDKNLLLLFTINIISYHHQQ